MCMISCSVWMKHKLFHKCTQQHVTFILESRADSHSTSKGAITGPQKCQLSCSCQGRCPDVLPHVGVTFCQSDNRQWLWAGIQICTHKNRTLTHKLKHFPKYPQCGAVQQKSPHLYTLSAALTMHTMRTDHLLKSFKNSDYSTCWIIRVDWAI